jgi:hypothetical protein
VQVDSDRTYHFALPATEVWRTLTRTDEYRTWWPWLRRFDPGPLTAGARFTCEVRPPLPYRVAFVLVIDDVRAPSVVTARVEGGLRGAARLAVTPAPGGCALHLTASLTPTDRLLRTVARVAPSVARFGHDWILDTGFRQFSAALGQPSPGP